MLRQTGVTILGFYVLCTFCTGQKYECGSRFPYVRDEPYPFITPNPVALETKTAKPINVESMEINIPTDSQILLKNFCTQVRGYQSRGEKITLTKGVVFRDKYALYELAHRNDGVSNGLAASTEDGKGGPLDLNIFWYNTKYKTPENALNHTDGFVILANPYIVEGNKDNLYLQPYVSAVTKVIPCNATTEISGGDALAWFTAIEPFCPYYYSFPGTYSFNGLETYPKANAITIQMPLTRPTAFASYRQFNIFTSVKNGVNGPLANPAPRFPAGSRPVVEVSACTKIYYGHKPYYRG